MLFTSFGDAALVRTPVAHIRAVVGYFHFAVSPNYTLTIAFTLLHLQVESEETVV